MSQSNPSTVTWRDKSMTMWSKSDVSDWIQSFSNMKQYSNNFIHINGKQLLQITDDELCQLIPNKYVNRSFKRKIEEHRVKHQSNNNNDEKYNDNISYNAVGLRNLGNTCYLNSSIQALLHSKEFVEYFRNERKYINKYKRNKTLLDDWTNLCQNTAPTNKHKVISPNKFRNALSQIDRRWGNGGQDDSIYVLFNILKVLDKQINEENDPYFTEIKCKKEIIIDNTDSDSDLFDYNEEKLIKHKFIPNYNPNDSIVRELFDGILCEESICCNDNCTYHEKKYSSFRFIRLPLSSSIIVLHNIDIYIPQQLKDQVITMKKCELMSYCNINTLKYKIKQYIYSEYNEWKGSSPIQLKNIQIGIIGPSNNQNIDGMVQYMNGDSTCDALTNITFAVVTFDNNTEPIVMMHFKITRTHHELSLQILVKNEIQETITSLKEKNHVNQFYPLFFVKNQYVDEYEVYKISVRTAILIIWIDKKTFDFAKSHIQDIIEFTKSHSIIQTRHIIGYIEQNKLLDKESIINYVFTSLNSTFGQRFKYNTNNNFFNHISESLDEYLKCVVLDSGAFAMFCKQCNECSSIVERRRAIVMTPKSLIIFINRCGGANKLIKINHPIKYDVEGMKIRESKENVLYDLNAAVNHHGSLHGGHYTANVRSINDSKLWFRTSDSNISTISINSVMSKNSLILIYKKQ